MDQADFRFFGFADLDWRPARDGTYNVQFTIYDGDTRRWLGVTVVGVDREKATIMWDGRNAVQGWAPIHSALGAGIDSGQLGLDVTAVNITFDGIILSVSRDSDGDTTPYVHYVSPDSYGLLLDMETVTRDQLFELGRLAPWVDIVSTRSEKLIFKHYSDVRARNIMVDPTNNLVLIDFGTAVRRGKVLSGAVTYRLLLRSDHWPLCRTRGQTPRRIPRAGEGKRRRAKRLSHAE